MFDAKIVKSNYRYTSPYKVTYYVYHDPTNTKRPARPKDPTKYPESKMLTGVCFSDLLRSLYKKGSGKTPLNRVCYHISFSTNPTCSKLSLAEKETWIRMCRKNGMLPDYVPLVAAKDGIFTVKLEDLPPSLLYCYLACFRHMREEPGFVRSMVYLVKKKDMDFYAAYVLASMVTISSSNKIHHPGEWTRKYVASKEVNNIRIPAGNIVALRTYLEDPKKYDKRSVHEVPHNDWHCGSSIRRAAQKLPVSLLAKQLANSKVIKALQSKSPETELRKMKVGKWSD